MKEVNMLRGQKTLIFLFLVFLAFQSHAERNCISSDIYSLELPVYADKINSEKFKYSYRLRLGESDKPVVIVLGGGPGQDTIAPATAPILGAFPASFNLVYTDPRSVGCNNTYAFADDALSTLALANDLASVIKHLQEGEFQGKPYYIYGASFGTQLATVLAVRLKELNFVLPKGVILEGVSGHHFKDFNDYFSHFQSEWEHIKRKDLQPSVLSFLTSTLPEQSSPLQFSSRVWGMFLSMQIILGYIPQKGREYRHLVDWYLTDEVGQNSARTQMIGIALSTNDGQHVESQQLFRAIGCREIWGEFRMGRDLVSGHLKAIGENICDGLKKDNPYDSKAWQIPVSIYYFQGPRDPTTTLSQAKYHFKHQSAPRKLVVVDQASHAPLTIGLKPCADQIWETIAQRPRRLRSVVTKCGHNLGTKIQFRSRKGRSS